MDKEEEFCEALTGQTVNRLFISADEQTLVFDTDKGALRVSVDGDCCSYSWFADFVRVEALLGAHVQSVESVDMEELGFEVPGVEWGCEEKVYGFSIKTSKGTATVAFRNSSNGYYGGYVSRVEWDQTDNFAGLKELFDDWSS